MGFARRVIKGLSGVVGGAEQAVVARSFTGGISGGRRGIGEGGRLFGPSFSFALARVWIFAKGSITGRSIGVG